MSGQQPIQDTSLRLLVMLQCMPVNRWLEVTDIHARMEARGFVVSLRTVQRDLWKMARHFGLECIEASEHGRKLAWRRTRPMDDTAPGLFRDEARGAA